jgi:hypothetical protein
MHLIKFLAGQETIGKAVNDFCKTKLGEGVFADYHFRHSHQGRVKTNPIARLDHAGQSRPELQRNLLR